MGLPQAGSHLHLMMSGFTLVMSRLVFLPILWSPHGASELSVYFISLVSMGIRVPALIIENPLHVDKPSNFKCLTSEIDMSK